MEVSRAGQFLDLVLSKGKKTVLEIGAGTGRDSLYFQQQGLDMTSIDLSGEMVKLCREKGINALYMDFYNLDFPPDRFDAV